MKPDKVKSKLRGSKSPRDGVRPAELDASSDGMLSPEKQVKADAKRSAELDASSDRMLPPEKQAKADAKRSAELDASSDGMLPPEKQAKADAKRSAELDASSDVMLSLDPQVRLDAKRAFALLSKQMIERSKMASKASATVRDVVETLLAERLRERYPDLMNPNAIATATMGPGEAVVALLGAVGAEHRTFIDIGCGMTGGNSHLLANVFQWRGMMVDAKQRSIDRIPLRFPISGVSAVCMMVTPQNINELVASAGFEGLDCFSLDIDSFDYWVLEALEARPRVLAVEYNAMLGADSLTVPKDSDKVGSMKFYSGASLSALASLVEGRGYRLIGVDRNGTNAFFVRDDLGSHLPSITPEQAWRGYLSRASGETSDLAASAQLLQEFRDKGLELVAV